MSCLSPLDADLAVVYPPLMAARQVEFLESRGIKFVEVPAEQLHALDAHLREAGIRISIGYLPTLRLVTHLDVDDDGVARTLAAFAGFFAGH